MSAPEEVPIPRPDDITAAAEGLLQLVMDDLPELCWDNISCARVLMQLSERLELMADKLIASPHPLVKLR